MKYEIIATGSTGNATVIDESILIDCGVPFKKLEPYSKKLKLVLLTHYHGDHFNPATVSTLAKRRPALRWACCHWMVPFLLAADVDKRCVDVTLPDHAIVYPDFCAVNPVQLYHNVSNCGWRVFKNGEKLLYATDTGKMEGIKAKDYDLYLVEANHTRYEIAERIFQKGIHGEYAYELQAAENHLSYEQAMDWLAENMGPRSLWVPMHGHVDRGEKDAEKVLLAEAEG